MMSSGWHQARARSIAIKDGTYRPPWEVHKIVLVTWEDGFMSCMSFGDNEQMARESLANHIKNQPKNYHYLYIDGKLAG